MLFRKMTIVVMAVGLSRAKRKNRMELSGNMKAECLQGALYAYVNKNRDSIVENLSEEEGRIEENFMNFVEENFNELLTNATLEYLKNPKAPHVVEVKSDHRLSPVIKALEPERKSGKQKNKMASDKMCRNWLDMLMRNSKGKSGAKAWDPSKFDIKEFPKLLKLSKMLQVHLKTYRNELSKIFKSQGDEKDDFADTTSSSNESVDGDFSNESNVLDGLKPEVLLSNRSIILDNGGDHDHDHDDSPHQVSLSLVDHSLEDDHEGKAAVEVLDSQNDQDISQSADGKDDHLDDDLFPDEYFDAHDVNDISLKAESDYLGKLKLNETMPNTKMASNPDNFNLEDPISDGDEDVGLGEGTHMKELEENYGDVADLTSKVDNESAWPISDVKTHRRKK